MITVSFSTPLIIRLSLCSSGIKRIRSPTLKKVVTFKSVVVDVENRLSQIDKNVRYKKYDIDNVNYIYIVDWSSFS